VTATDTAGNESMATSITVNDTTKPGAPVVNPVTDQDTRVTVLQKQKLL
jgi:hypothetical protein